MSHRRSKYRNRIDGRRGGATCEKRQNRHSARIGVARTAGLRADAGFTLKRIQYLDVLQEEAESHGDDAASLAFASQILMAEALSTMVDELAAHLGGWQD